MTTANYPPIIVTGPQRSGTTIVTQILAEDLKRTPVDEIDFFPGRNFTNCVVQAPTAMDYYVILIHMYPGLQFVFVDRPRKDIIASMKRIQWCRNDVQNWEQFLEQHLDARLHLWKVIKDRYPESCNEIAFQSLQKHPLFVQQDQRTAFTSRQWQLNNPIGPKYWRNNLECTKQLYGERYSECIT